MSLVVFILQRMIQGRGEPDSSYCTDKFCDILLFSNGSVETHATYGVVFQKLTH